ncbi:MAG: hypothetical protein AB8B56_01185 [Crocinitomicaceae bacterium]
MKITTIIVLFGSLFILTACPGNSYQSALERIQENGMDFPDLQSKRYGSVKFQLSNLFSPDYGMDYTLLDNARGFVIYDMDVHFSVERFESDDVEMIQFSFDDEIPAIDAVHDNYILKRESSLYNGDTGIKKELPNSVNFPGYVQVIEGATSSYLDNLSYFTATLNINGEFHVFQLIGKGENMGYLYDDFIDILSSVKL